MGLCGISFLIPFLFCSFLAVALVAGGGGPTWEFFSAHFIRQFRLFVAAFNWGPGAVDWLRCCALFHSPSLSHFPPSLLSIFPPSLPSFFLPSIHPSLSLYPLKRRDFVASSSPCAFALRPTMTRGRADLPRCRTERQRSSANVPRRVPRSLRCWENMRKAGVEGAWGRPSANEHHIGFIIPQIAVLVGFPRVA